MYVRNVKQILRSADPAFDERRFGINGSLELVRACQRDGVLRLERDRRGVLRVFPGVALQRQPVEGEPASELPGAPAAAAGEELARLSRKRRPCHRVAGICPGSHLPAAW
jgi:hypothetical protein